MLNKEKVKRFWNKNKDLIVGTTIGVTGTLFGLWLGNKISKPVSANSNPVFESSTKENDYKLMFDLLETIDEARKGANMYVQFTGEEFRNLGAAEIAYGLVGTGNGEGPLLDITGGIFFGNPVGRK